MWLMLFSRISIDWYLAVKVDMLGWSVCLVAVLLQLQHYFTFKYLCLVRQPWVHTASCKTIKQEALKILFTDRGYCRKAHKVLSWSPSGNMSLQPLVFYPRPNRGAICTVLGFGRTLEGWRCCTAAALITTSPVDTVDSALGWLRLWIHCLHQSGSCCNIHQIGFHTRLHSMQQMITKSAGK